LLQRRRHPDAEQEQTAQQQNHRGRAIGARGVGGLGVFARAGQDAGELLKGGSPTAATAANPMSNPVTGSTFITPGPMTRNSRE